MGTATFDPTKYGAIKVNGNNSTGSLNLSKPTNNFDPTKFGAKPAAVAEQPVKSFRYEVPKPVLTPMQKKAKYDAEQVAYDAENKKENSPLGFLKNFVKAPSNDNLLFVGGAVKTARILNKSIASGPTENEVKLNQQLTKRNFDLHKIIEKKKKSGVDFSADAREYNSNQDIIDKHVADTEKSNTEMPTNSQALGAVAQTGLDIASVGTYGKGAKEMSTGTLFKGKPSIIPKNPKIKSMDTVKDMALGGAYGLGYGGTQAAYDKSETPIKDTIVSGVVGTLIPLALKVPGAIKNNYTKDPTSGITPHTQKKVDKVAKEIAKVENNYAPLRKVDSNPIRAKARDNLARTGFLESAIDTDGTIRTTTKGGVVDKINEIVKPYEQVVTKGVERENIFLPKDVIKKKLVSVIEKSGIAGKDRGNALRNIEKEIAGLRVDPKTGKINLSEVQAAKIYKYTHVDYLNPGSKEYDKAVARAFKEIVEENYKMAKSLNSDLGDIYAVRELAADLDGRKVRGGKLGKYVSGLVGAVGGTVAGGVVGGPVGAVAGGTLGAELGSHLKGVSMSKKFKGPQLGINVSPRLEDAKKAIDAGTRKVKIKSIPSDFKSELPVIAFGKPATSKHLKVDKTLPVAKGHPNVFSEKEIVGDVKNNIKMAKNQITDSLEYLGKKSITTAEKVKILTHIKEDAMQALKLGGYKIPKKLETITFTGKEKPFEAGEAVLKMVDEAMGRTMSKNVLGSLSKNVEKVKAIPNKQGGFIKIPGLGTPKKNPTQEKAVKFLEGHFGTNAYIGQKGKAPKWSPKDIEEIGKHFEKYKPTKPITVYRGIEKGQKPTLKRTSSWTISRDVAEMHTYGTGKVIKMKVDPKDILVDVNSIPKNLLPKKADIIFDEEEIILKPFKAAKGQIKSLKIRKNNNYD